MIYEEIKENYNKAYKAYNAFRNEFERSWDFDNKGYTEFSNALYDSEEYKELYKWDALERLNRVPTMRPIKYEWENDCKMTLDDFLETIKLGYITDWDGSGYYGTEDKVSDISVNIDQMIEGQYRKDFDYIYWYNK